MANENPSFYAIIPANVRYDNTIVANAKLLFGEITALSDKHGYCFATNDYFAELYGRDGKTISRWITSLKNAGYIDVEYFYRGAEVTERRIYLSDSRVIKSSLKVQKSHSTGDEKITRTGDEKVTDINTSIIITSKDILSRVSESHKSSKLPDDAIKSANLLFNRISERTNPPVWKTRPPKVDAWAKDIDALNRIDGIAFPDIDKVIEWCTANEFWKTNILSGAKLRKHFNMLHAQMTRECSPKMSDDEKRREERRKHQANL